MNAPQSFHVRAWDSSDHTASTGAVVWRVAVTVRRASGTATKIISRGYGDLAAQGDGAQLELRASWTPRDEDLTAHVEAWEEIVAMLAGLPPASDGVTLLAPRRTTK